MFSWVQSQRSSGDGPDVSAYSDFPYQPASW
jgi:hypothetical protein